MAKIKLQIKNRCTGSILFEYEKDDNTIKDTVIEAVKNTADLRCADLGGAYLRGANLGGADLRDADLRCADLRCADLGGADLGGAYLRGADFRDANLGGAYLGGADLRGAYLRGAYLGGADLGGADLRDADLRCADLGGADLGGADLGGAKNIPFIPLACPTDGAFIGWKKVRGCLIKLEIPEDAKRSSATTNKCRCDKAKVLGIYDLDGTPTSVTEVLNTNQKETLYKVGEIVLPDSFDEDRFNECSHGIHFFIDKQSAINY